MRFDLARAVAVSPLDGRRPWLPERFSSLFRGKVGVADGDGDGMTPPVSLFP